MIRYVKKEWAFVTCALLLAVAGGGMSMAMKKFEMYARKIPLPLKKSLESMDQSDLGPYKVLKKLKIDNKDILDNLGTEDYIQWYLEDTHVDPASLGSHCFLFITYYSLPDRVPHVPEECFAGSGFQQLSSEPLTLEIRKQDGPETVPARQLIFAGSKPDLLGRSETFSVFYLFNVNGGYANSRETVRLALNKNIFGKYSYFCKVEWHFLDSNGNKMNPATKEAIAASQKLLEVILPILETEHWPAWEK
jgi:hypothetical protein